MQEREDAKMFMLMANPRAFESVFSRDGAGRFCKD